MKLDGAKIVVTGGSGFLCKAVCKELEVRGAKNILTPRSKDHDLREMRHCLEITEGRDMVIHLAAHVGGIGLNQEKPGELFYDNAIMGIQLIEAARRNKVKKVVIVSTICAYPKFTPIPFKEQDLWEGYPEETNAPYGIAKKALLVQLNAYRQQYGMNGVYLLPVNLYGPGDNFDPGSSHVIPAMIQKIHDAQVSDRKSITLWGDGTPTREFLYVDDAAFGIVEAAEKFNGDEPVNLGTEQEISIKDLAQTIAREMKFDGKLEWDTSKPNGQPRRKLSTERAKKLFGFTARTDFQTGLRKTIEWYRSQHES